MTPRMNRIRQATKMYLSMGYKRDEIARMYRSERSYEKMLLWMENGGFVSNRLNKTAKR